MTTESTTVRIDREMGDWRDPKHWAKRTFPTSRRLLLERALENLDLSNLQSVLIVGAGHDPYRYLFGEVPDYVRMDIEKVDGVTDVVGDAMDMPFPDARFSCVVATECMEHLHDPFKFIEEVKRVLKPTGRVILTVPFMFHQHGDPYDFWRPTATTLLNMFSDFSQVDVIALGTRVHVISDLVTTAANPGNLLTLGRAFNHLLARLPGSIRPARGASSAPTGFLVDAKR